MSCVCTSAIRMYTFRRQSRKSTSGRTDKALGQLCFLPIHRVAEADEHVYDKNLEKLPAYLHISPWYRSNHRDPMVLCGNASRKSASGNVLARPFWHALSESYSQKLDGDCPSYHWTSSLTMECTFHEISRTTLFWNVG